MDSLQQEMSRLFFILNPEVSATGSISVQFISAVPQEGVSSIAREFALTAARQIDGKVLLLDLNLTGKSQVETLMDADNQYRFGEIGPASRVMDESKAAHKRFSGIWTHNADTPKSERSVPLVTFHPVGEKDLYVTHTNKEMIARYGPPRVNSTSNYWSSLSKVFQMIVIDSAALSTSYDGLAVCKYFDASVMVVSAERTRRPVITNLRDRLIDNDGHVAGMVFNRRKMHIPKAIYKLL